MLGRISLPCAFTSSSRYHPPIMVSSRLVTVALIGWLAVYVNAQGKLILPSICRDQSPKNFGPCAADRPLSTCKVDFEWANNGPEPGIVQTQLNTATRTPIYCCGNGQSPKNTVHNQASFDTWFNDSPFTKKVAHNLTLTNTPGNPRVYGFDSIRYFPFSGKGWDVPAGTDQYRDLDGNLQNFHFCSEAHGRFAYKGGEEFSFLGDDDVFVFINNKLALDLGGVHGPQSASFQLDNIARAFGLTLKQNYRFDFFWCERHTLGSNVKLTTSLEIYCSYYDWCGECDGNGQSCCKPTDCVDSDPCTIDQCDVLVPPTLNCIHRPINCTVPDICHTSACSRPSGLCVDTPITCPTDNNPCTVDQCVAAQGGCIYPNKVCDDNQGLCTTKQCSPDTGDCVFTAVDCDDDNACTIDTCVPAVGCVHKVDTCNDDNACTVDTCDKTTGCQHKSRDCGCDPLVCPTTDPCNPASCDATKKCTTVPVNCDDGNPCTADSCSVVGGAPLCVNTPRVCAGSTPCTPQVCNITNGACEAKPVNCDDGIKCTIDTCNTNGTCVHTLRVCDDNNACTSDTCDNQSPLPTGCSHTPITCANTTCSVATCDIQFGCVLQHDDRCSRFSNSSFCVAGSCDEAVGCLNTTRTCLLSEMKLDPSHWIDNYPDQWKVDPTDNTKYKGEDCFTASCDLVADKCVVAQREPFSGSCSFAYLDQVTQAGILTGGIIAGIVIAAVVFAALAGFGAKKGYDAWVRMHDEKMGAAATNPMYAPSAGAGTNPLHA
eukprot:TRINITY_DN5_c0_g1_i4.p1 TRINITY_DN5_c0_g1~~TRINITY_DN5_c0_g1_i4.p1  ORF type:complete len:769 (-),score=169.15 TRINITY_DN5_c0_g1_i4:143-2449(-)